jgi:RNA polymerase sigma-70 factor (ECF subfamily)
LCIAEYGPLVWSIARRMSPGPAQAEDAVQEIFIELWKHAGRYDPAQASEPAFVTMIARSRMLDRLRQAERRRRPEPRADALAGEQHDAIERCAEAALAAATLAALDPRQRRALTLVIGHGMTHDEVSTLTEMPVGTVKSLVRRALVAVRKRLLEFGAAVEARSDAE